MKEWLGTWTIHALLSHYFGLTSIHKLYYVEGLKDQNPKVVERYKEIVLGNIIQRAYAHNIHNLGMKFLSNSRNLIIGVTYPEDHLDYPRKYSEPAKLEDLAEDYYKSLNELIGYLPATPVIESIEPINEKQRELCENADICGEMSVYIANRFFSPDFQRDVHMLKEDLDSFWTNIRHVFEKEDIRIIYARFIGISAKADYLSHAIEPLVWNVRDHAFNPENDINERMKKEKFCKYVGVWGNPENEIKDEEGLERPAPSGNYIVTVRDNGFGIRPEILEHLFEKGTTTKDDKTTEHGIGLYVVKEFVEINGGTISVKSELGKGTAFRFTIPYSRVKDFVCVQE